MPQYDIQDIYQGSDYTLLFQAKDNCGNVIDLTNYQIHAVIQEKYSSTSGIANFTPTITVSQSGICQLYLDYIQTSGLPANTYVYNVWVNNSGNTSVFSLLQGYLNVNPLPLF